MYCMKFIMDCIKFILDCKNFFSSGAERYSGRCSVR